MQLDRPLVQIRERGMMEQLDLALAVLQRRPLALIAAALAGIAPFEALNYALLELFPDRSALWPVLVILEAQLATTPLTVVLGGMMFDERPGPGRVARSIGRSIVPLVLFAGLVRGLILLSVVLVPFFADRVLFYDEVILLERSRVDEVSRRAKLLGDGLGGEATARMLVQVILATLLVVATWWGASKFVEMMVETYTMTLPEGLTSRLAPRVALWVAVAFFGIGRFLGYIDQRIRQEGWEVELRLRAAGAALEDVRRW